MRRGGWSESGIAESLVFATAKMRPDILNSKTQFPLPGMNGGSSGSKRVFADLSLQEVEKIIVKQEANQKKQSNISSESILDEKYGFIKAEKNRFFV